jgi:hypothetical protein
VTLALTTAQYFMLPILISLGAMLALAHHWDRVKKLQPALARVRKRRC